MDSGGAMAVGAVELDDGTVGALADGVHVDGVIEKDGAGIFRVVEKSREFRMAAFEACDVGGVVQWARGDAELRVALSTGLVAGRVELNTAAMFHVASGAGGDGGGDFIFVVPRAVVAGETGGVCGGGGEFAALRDMASGALFFDNGVGSAHGAAGVDARIAGIAAPSDPSDSEKRDEDGEEEFRALERRGSLEIVQVDALSELLRCARACHSCLPCAG